MANGLPPGFDPRTGRLTGLGSTPRHNTTYSPPSSTYTPTYSYSFWGRLNNGVASIGNWFANWIEGACTVIMWTIIVILAISAIIGLISMICDGHLVGAILLAIFVGPIAYYGAAIIGWIGYGIAAAVLYSLRFLFWNAWSLLSVLVIAGGILIYASCSSSPKPEAEKETTEIAVATPYTCNTYALNVRSGPSTSYIVIDTLHKGDRVEVIRVVGNFAEIRYAGGTGYASIKYLTPSQL